MKSKLIHQRVARVLVAALLLTFGLVVKRLPAMEEPGLRVAKMEIDIWPEYDDPRVLVIYSGELESDVEVPSEFSFMIPRGAQIHMAGAIGPKGGHLHAQFQTRPKGETLTEVYYQLQTRKFYMEFYYDPFTGGENKQFRYPLVSPYPVASLVVRVQQPLKARDFRTSPVAVDVMSDQKGFKYHRLLFDEIRASEEKSVAVSYLKKDKNPSIAKAGATTAGGSNAMKNILIIGSVLLLGVIGYGVFANSRSKKHLPDRAHRRPKAQKPPISANHAQADQYKYCVECGAEMQRSDNFCSNCGTKAARVP